MFDMSFHQVSSSYLWRALISSNEVLIMQSHYLLHFFSIFCPIRIVRYSIWNYCCKDFGKVKMIVLGLILIIGQKNVIYFSGLDLTRLNCCTTIKRIEKVLWEKSVRMSVIHLGGPLLHPNTYSICNIDHIYYITYRV